MCPCRQCWIRQRNSTSTLVTFDDWKGAKTGLDAIILCKMVFICSRYFHKWKKRSNNLLLINFVSQALADQPVGKSRSTMWWTWMSIGPCSLIILSPTDDAMCIHSTYLNFHRHREPIKKPTYLESTNIFFLFIHALQFKHNVLLNQWSHFHTKFT